MPAKKWERVDYSSMPLDEIVKRKLRKDAPFTALEPRDKQFILKFLNLNSVNIRVFGQKWYDVLGKKFHALEYVLTDSLSLGDQTQERVFDSFGEYFAYVQGDIYENACYFGYSFSQEEIKKYSLDVTKMNFESFLDKDINGFIKPIVPETSLAEVKRMFDWIRSQEPIKSLNQLEETLAAFIKIYGNRRSLFLSVFCRNKNKETQQIALSFFCKHGFSCGISFGDILFRFGWDAALQAIGNYSPEGSKSIQKDKGLFERALVDYNENRLAQKENISFRSKTRIYCVRRTFELPYRDVLRTLDCFDSFDEFANFLDGNLSNADLRAAPLSKEKVLQYKTNEKTVFPRPKGEDCLKVEKRFENGRFIVDAKWIDGYGVILSKHRFFSQYFFDFVHYLNGDLSNADLTLCDGIENLKTLPGLKLDGVKIKSAAAEQLGMSIKRLPKDAYSTKSFDMTLKNEIGSTNQLMEKRLEEGGERETVCYVSDIHLRHRFMAYGCRTEDDVTGVLRIITKTLGEQGSLINLIGGDVTGDFALFKDFASRLALAGPYKTFFFVLGNHELWPFQGVSFKKIVNFYRNALKESEYCKERLFLVQNNLFYKTGSAWNEIKEKELASLETRDLREKVKAASAIIFGGTGLSGKNEKFNANNGIYQNVLSRAEEIKESARFLKLYLKIAEALRGRHPIILTHMPMEDWGGDIGPEPGFVYVSGHNHRNHFFDDGKTRIFSDNQIGYRGKCVSMKGIPFDFGFDWFADYQDGIHEITREDYQQYYRGIGESLIFSRPFAKLYMLKREGAYMFFLQNRCGKLMILNGGSIKSAGDHDLEYFYANMVNYVRSVKLFLSKYNEYQKQISDEVKKIGGTGNIHGAIVDIDFFNHLYVNWFDGAIVPYSADSMVEKYVYKNLPSLLKYERSDLYANYTKLISRSKQRFAIAPKGKSLKLSAKTKYVESTEIYRVSRLLKGLQFTTNYSLIRVWPDIQASGGSQENGKLILNSIINPDS